jgi:hypothetical protein
VPYFKCDGFNMAWTPSFTILHKGMTVIILPRTLKPYLRRKKIKQLSSPTMARYSALLLIGHFDDAIEFRVCDWWGTEVCVMAC